MNRSNPIGLNFIQGESGERKSGTPHSVEIPAPVKIVTRAASAMRRESSVRASDTEERTKLDSDAKSAVARHIGVAMR